MGCKFKINDRVITNIHYYNCFDYKPIKGIVKNITCESECGDYYYVITICTKDGMKDLGEYWLDLDCTKLITTGGLKIGDYVYVSETWNEELSKLKYPWYTPIYRAERCNKEKKEKVKECEQNKKILELVEKRDNWKEYCIKWAEINNYKDRRIKKLKDELEELKISNKELNETIKHLCDKSDRFSVQFLALILVGTLGILIGKFIL